MRWPAAMVFAAVSAVGCHSAPRTFDPFLPRTTIPPPPTGAASGAPDANYVSPAAPYASPPAYPQPAVGAPAGGNGNGLFAPPAGQYQPGPTPAPVGGGYGTTPGPVNSTQFSPARQGNQSTPATRTSYATTVDDEPSAVYERRRPAKTAAATTKDASSPAIDIMDLSPVLASRR